MVIWLLTGYISFYAWKISSRGERNMIIKSIFTFFVLLNTAQGSSFSEYLPSTFTWEHQCKDIEQLADGTYAATFGMVFEDLYLLHLDSSGNVITRQNNLTVSERGLEGGGWILPIEEGGCFVVAYSEPRATGANSDIVIFRLDSECSIEWSHNLGENSEDAYTCFGTAKTNDAGLVVFGGRGYPGENTFVKSYSADGELQWEYIFDEDDGYLPLSIGEAAGGNLVLLSRMWNDTTYLQKLDNNGNLEWTTELPYKPRSGPSSFCSLETGYGVYYTGGEESNTGISAVIDLSGNLLESACFTHGMLVQDAEIQENSEIILAGSRVTDEENCAVIEVMDLEGNLSRQGILDNNEENRLTAVCKTSDGGLVLLGYTTYNQADEDSISSFIVKIDSPAIVSEGANPTVIALPSGNNQE